MRTLPARSDLTVQTHEVLRAAIISGELSPCAPLAQEELAERLGVSRQPISHALKLLKQEGLVVAPIDAERLLALYQVRGALDRLAAQLVASAAPLLSTTTDQLEQLIEQCRIADSNGDIASMVEADIAFHRLLHTLSGNGEIATATETLWPHIERAMHTVLVHHPVRSDIWREHRAIADAIIAGDALKAGELAAQHAEVAGANTHQRLLEIQTDTTKQS
jgi:DNA-binding GntR family transcriptional regulator